MSSHENRAIRGGTKDFVRHGPDGYGKASGDSRSNKDHLYLGAFGCGRAQRIVLMSAPPGSRRTKGANSLTSRCWIQECPACGEVHRMDPEWRLVPREERRRKSEGTLKWSTATVKRKKNRNAK